MGDKRTEQFILVIYLMISEMPMNLRAQFEKELLGRSVIDLLDIVATAILQLPNSISGACKVNLQAYHVCLMTCNVSRTKSTFVKSD